MRTLFIVVQDAVAVAVGQAIQQALHAPGGLKVDGIRKLDVAKFSGVLTLGESIIEILPEFDV
jgi:phosphoribosylformylglycinamidine (FGAM) synthase PurS component